MLFRRAFHYRDWVPVYHGVVVLIHAPLRGLQVREEKAHGGFDQVRDGTPARILPGEPLHFVFQGRQNLRAHGAVRFPSCP